MYFAVDVARVSACVRARKYVNGVHISVLSCPLQINAYVETYCFSLL